MRRSHRLSNTRLAWSAAIVSLACGCGGDAGPSVPSGPSGSTGVIRVVLSTNGIRPDGAYTVLLDATAPRVVTGNGNTTYAGVAPGTHVIDLTEVAPNCVTATLGRNVTVTAGQTTEITFDVECGRLIFVGGWASRGFWIIEDVTFTTVDVGLTEGYSPVGATTNANGSTIYFNRNRANPAVPRGVGIASAESLEFLEHISVPGSPLLVELSADETELYVLHDEGILSFVDLVTRTEVDRIVFGGANRTRDLALLPDKSRLYVTDEALRRAYVVNPASRQLVRSITTPGDAVAVATASDGSRTYVRTSSPGTNKLLILDPTTDAVTQTIDLPDSGYGILPDPDGSVLYVALETQGRVAVLDAGTFAEVGSFPAMRPSQMVISDDRQRLYVTQRTNMLTIVDLRSGEVEHQGPTGGEPWTVVVFPPH